MPVAISTIIPVVATSAPAGNMVSLDKKSKGAMVLSKCSQSKAKEDLRVQQ